MAEEEVNFLVAKMPGEKIQVKANKSGRVLLPLRRINGYLNQTYKTPRKGPVTTGYPNLPEAATPRTGTHGRGLGTTKKGGKRRKNRATKRKSRK